MNIDKELKAQQAKLGAAKTATAEYLRLAKSQIEELERLGSEYFSLASAFGDMAKSSLRAAEELKKQLGL